MGCFTNHLWVDLRANFPNVCFFYTGQQLPLVDKRYNTQIDEAGIFRGHHQSNATLTHTENCFKAAGISWANQQNDQPAAKTLIGFVCFGCAIIMCDLRQTKIEHAQRFG